MNKQTLKKGYYYEFKEIYDTLPDILPVPTDYITKTNERMMTEEEMVQGQEFLSKEEAFGLACKIIEDNKIEKYTSQIIWFKDEGELCKVRVWLNSDGWLVRILKFNASGKWDAGRVSFFRNKDTQTFKSDDALTLKNSDTMSFDQALKIVKDAGCKVYQIKEVEL